MLEKPISNSHILCILLMHFADYSTYFIFIVLTPLLVFCYCLISSNEKQDYQHSKQLWGLVSYLFVRLLFTSGAAVLSTTNHITFMVNFYFNLNSRNLTLLTWAAASLQLTYK